jgi:hypothetical protein
MNAKAGEVVDQETGEITRESTTLAVLHTAEIDQQIATAKQYPRSIRKFRDRALELVTLNEHVADECIYAVPRGGKMIEGPSVRFAEIMMHAWGNARAGARVVAVKGATVVAQGVFRDLETNNEITVEIERRITNKNVQRFNDDIIATTGNAACSIALLNAITRGVPAALWGDIYQAARHTAIGDSTTLASKRADALAFMQKFGATEAMIVAKLGVAGVEDIGLEHLALLRGMANSLKEGTATVEELFSTPDGDTSGAAPAASQKGAAAAKDALRGKAKEDPAKEREPGQD